MTAPRRRLKDLIAGLATLACLFGFGWVATGLSAAGSTSAVGIEGRVNRDAVALEAREILLRVEGESLPVPLGSLGFRVDRVRTLANFAAADDQRQSFFARQAKRYFEPEQRPRPEPTVVWAFDSSTASATLTEWAPRVRRAARDAVFDIAHHLREPEVWGRELNVGLTLTYVAALDPIADDQVPLVLDAVAPRVTLRDLPPLDPRKILARFDTDFRKKRGPRVHNIQTAAAYLDGTLIAPGGTLSFNQTVGPRSAERGFIDAPVIVNDVMESGMGGGVCQVATALHAAAIFGGLEITERRSHSRPSGYAPLGLDATVLDGVQDLKIRNPYAVPVYVRAYLPSRYVVTVELLGVELEGNVEHDYWVVQRQAYTRRVVQKQGLAPGEFKQGQRGGYGYDTVSTVTHALPNGNKSQFRYKSKYYPVPEVMWVGPDTNIGNLPALPKGAIATDATSAVVLGLER